MSSVIACDSTSSIPESKNKRVNTNVCENLEDGTQSKNAGRMKLS